MDDNLKFKFKERVTFLENVIEDIPVGVIVLDNDGRVVMMNRTQEMVSKVKRRKVLGTLFHVSWKNIFDMRSSSNETFGNLYWELVNKKKPYVFVFHDVTPQFYGEKISGLSYGAPMPSGDGFILVHEISDEIKQDKIYLNKLNQQLSRSTAFLENLLDASPNAVITVDEKGIIQTINKTAEKLFKIPYTDFLRRPVFDLFDDDQVIEKHIKKDSIKEGIEITCRKSDGQLFQAKMQLSSFSSSDEASLSRLFLFRDITLEKSLALSISERLKFEETISKLSSNFINLPAQMIDEKIEEGLKIIGDFLEIDVSGLSQFLKKGESLKVTHSSSSLESPLLLGQELDTSVPWYTNKIRNGETIILPRVMDDVPKEATLERRYFEREGYKSHLGIPLAVGKEILGFISFTSIRVYRSWPEDLVKRLRIVAEIFANILMRKKTEASLEKAFSEIRALKNNIELERNYLRDEIRLEHNFENIIGQSEALQYVLFKVEKVAPTDSTVLILGETGTGKELFARAIHNESRRKDRPLLKVNCATLAGNLIESELFGHEKGAFTGAHARHVGRFELADGATIFLDEIGELPLELQSKLLRVLQEGEFERIGGSRTIRVDVRIIAATNRNLEDEVEKGRFREDLYYRLNVFPISIPPLRNRKEDLPLLINAFTKKISKRIGKHIDHIPRSTITALEGHSWPGNIRELENTIERAVINSQGSGLEVADKFNPAIAEPVQKKPSKTLAQIERDYITRVLEEKKWIIEGKYGAAKVLGLAPSTLRNRMIKLSIERT
jgi:formate hydrogenlyase transcriptional activator